MMTTKGAPLTIDLKFTQFTLDDVQETLFNTSCSSCTSTVDPLGIPFFELKKFDLFDIFRDSSVLQTSFEMGFSLDAGGLEATIPPLLLDINKTDTGGLVARIEVIHFSQQRGGLYSLSFSGKAAQLVFPLLVDPNKVHSLEDVRVSLLVHEQQVAVDLVLGKFEDGVFFFCGFTLLSSLLFPFLGRTGFDHNWI